jgi:RNA 2',3'-cyclic 3'-phosphodiesterase
VTRRSDAASLRLFVAADLPGDVEATIRAWQRRELAADARLRLTGSLHVTLCFLGDTPAERVDDIAAALRQVTVPRLPIDLTEALFLPERGRKSVVALRVGDPSGALVRLRSGMSETLVDMRCLRPETRPYLPHLTVARFRRPGHPFSLQNVTVEGVFLPSVILYSSVLEKGGAVHTPLATFPAT